jgi:hypothetical protein
MREQILSILHFYFSVRRSKKLCLRLNQCLRRLWDKYALLSSLQIWWFVIWAGAQVITHSSSYLRWSTQVAGHNMVGIQFFLNDLPGNDFNHIFQSVERFKNSVTTHHKGERLLPFYIAGLSGSYYTRLFPSQSVHLFHSSYSLHWYSQVQNMRIHNLGSVIYNSIIFVQILDWSSLC